MKSNNLSPTSESFNLFTDYYDLIYREKNYVQETKYVIDILNNYSPGAHHLLELGFGTGNFSKHFIEAGYKITGIEKSKKMVNLAKRKSISNFIALADDIITFNLNKKFDAAISLFHVISYLTKNTDVLLCLNQVSKHLKKDSVFVFDTWYTPAVYIQQPRKTTKHITTEFCEITRIAEPIVSYQNNTVQISYQLLIKNKLTQQVEELKEVHNVRHFSIPEIKLLAKLAGFRFIRAEEFLTAKKPCADTWGVCYILQKI